MKVLYTEEDFVSAKSRQKLPLQCEICNKTFYRGKNEIQVVLSGRNTKHKQNFCSRACQFIFLNPPLYVECKQCGKSFKKIKSHIKKSKHNFCSRLCSCRYNLKHKTKGTRCSKLEKWLATKLPSLYPDLEFHFNRKDTINSELDIYIPSLKLAFELNGIFHYKPIFSKEKLNQIKNNDLRKTQACLERGIELCIIDTSKHKYFKEQTCLPFLKIIQDIILSKLSGVASNPIEETT